MNLVLLSAIAAALAGGAHVAADYAGARRLTYLFKPLTMLCILALALASGDGGTELDGRYQYLVIGALLCSLVGDVFLMLPGDRIAAGLASFLLAHLFYAAAFLPAPLPSVDAWLLLYGAYALLLFVLLGRFLGRLRVAGIVYMLVLLTMSWLALQRWLQGDAAGAGYAFAGTLAFLFSDTVLAWHHFRRPFPAAQALLLPSYYLAQWLIALSVWMLSQAQAG